MNFSRVSSSVALTACAASLAVALTACGSDAKPAATTTQAPLVTTTPTPVTALDNSSTAAARSCPMAEGQGGAPEWTLNGAESPRYHGNLNIRRDGVDVARLMSELRDIAFSAGSACASGSGRPSHVLRAIGLSDPQARSSIRIGFGRYTREEELRDALNRIFRAAREQERPPS